MVLRLLITVSSLLFICLLPNDATANSGVIIVLPDRMAGLDTKQCDITEDTCKGYLVEIQKYAVRNLQVERFLVAKGQVPNMPIATNMLQPDIDLNRQTSAQEYAEACVKEPGMNICSLSGRNSDGDVIIFIKRYKVDYVRSHRKFAEDRIANVLMEWREQISKIKRRDISDMIASYNTAQKEEVLQFAAKLLHSYAWKVGCGFADFFVTNNEFKEVLACFFAPPKLQSGEVLYVPGCEPCSHCPEGTTCNREQRFILTDALCEVKSPDKIFPRNFELPREKICHEVEEIVPSKAVQVQLDAVENSMQQCRGRLLCSPGWKQKGGYFSIHVRRKCSSAVIFPDKINIQSDSCFQFFYFKRTNTSYWNSEVIAFAFQINDTDKRIKVVNNEANGHFMYLDIQWPGVDLYVGFGTRSLSASNDYEIKVKNFLVTSGKCPT